MLREIIVVAFSMSIAIMLAIAIFAGNTKDRLTVRMILLMAATGITAGLLVWTYLKDDSPTKIIVRCILMYTFGATIATKLIGNIIKALTNIPEDKIQKIGIDYMRKRMGLTEEDTKDDTTQ